MLVSRGYISKSIWCTDGRADISIGGLDLRQEFQCLESWVMSPIGRLVQENLGTCLSLTDLFEIALLHASRAPRSTGSKEPSAQSSSSSKRCSPSVPEWLFLGFAAGSNWESAFGSTFSCYTPRPAWNFSFHLLIVDAQKDRRGPKPAEFVATASQSLRKLRKQQRQKTLGRQTSQAKDDIGGARLEPRRAIIFWSGKWTAPILEQRVAATFRRFPIILAHYLTNYITN